MSEILTYHQILLLVGYKFPAFWADSRGWNVVKATSFAQSKGLSSGLQQSIQREIELLRQNTMGCTCYEQLRFELNKDRVIDFLRILLVFCH